MAKTRKMPRSISFKPDNLEFVDEVLSDETEMDRSWIINALIEEYRRRREAGAAPELFPPMAVIRQPERQPVTS